MTDLREIVLDTETTGLEPPDHRIVEIGALELINHIPTGRTFHEYINPERLMPAEAQAIHGISDADLDGKPLFRDIAEKFTAFIGDAMLVIHNAAFDVKFLNAELERWQFPAIQMNRVSDTLEMARKRYPGAQNSLDGLCRRFGVDSSRRVKHGALLDSELLAEVYVELMGGRQSRLTLDSIAAGGISSGDGPTAFAPARSREKPRPVLLSEEESVAHAAFVATLGDDPLWNAQEA